MKYNPFSRLDVPKMLERLGIKAQARAGGRKYAASCPNPNHPDKSPSWYIKNIPGEHLHGAHSCLACGFKGGPKLLAATLLGVSEADARAWLLDLSAPPPLPTRIELEVREDKRYTQFKLPDCFQFAPLDQWPKKHREYALGRITSEQIEDWGLGFVTDCHCENKRHSNRIAIPVYNSAGVPLAYTTRSVTGSKLKYVEPKTIENAKRVIFGEQYWKGKDVLIVVEGIFDALAVEQVLGTDIAVGALRGSSPLPLDLARISKFPLVVVMTDPDGAGRKARNEIHNNCMRHTKVVDVEVDALVSESGEKNDPSLMIRTEEGRTELNRILIDVITRNR